MDEQAVLLRRLTEVVAATTQTAPLTQRLCLAVAEIVGLDGASMTIGFAAPSRTTLCATDEVAERIDELQEIAREGPALDAHRLGRVVDVETSEIARRWPMLAQSLADGLPTARLVAAPMKPDSEVLGVLTLHGAAETELAVTGEELQFLANAIGIAVLGGFERSEGTDELWSTRDLVNQATGMVVAQLGVQPSDAIAVLRAHAFAHDTTLADIAADVVDRSLNFQPTTTEGADDD